MPPSDFKKLKNEMSDIIFQVAMVLELRKTAGPDTEDEEDTTAGVTVNTLVQLRLALDSVRYSVERRNVVRSTAHQRLLFELRDDEFRAFTRVTKTTFNILLEMIRQDVVFQPSPNAKKMQRDVAIQLAVALEWYGSFGNGNSVAHFARIYGMGAGTVPTYIRRVQKALLRHYTSWVSWPSCQQRMVSAAYHEKRFGLTEGVVGFVDGTHVIFDQKPHIQGSFHYNRKCRYSFNVQIVCNEDKVILFAFTGWLGSCCDSTVFAKTPIAQCPERFFSGGEYLVGDTGYALNTRLITPYKLPAAAKEENAVYNEVISSARVINENCIGLLKNRWMSLKGIRTQINRKQDFRHVNNHVLACVMLHNLGIALVDEWDDDEGDELDDDDAANSISHGGRTAQEKRERIKHALLRD